MSIATMDKQDKKEHDTCGKPVKPKKPIPTKEEPVKIPVPSQV